MFAGWNCCNKGGRTDIGCVRAPHQPNFDTAVTHVVDAVTTTHKDEICDSTPMAGPLPIVSSVNVVGGDAQESGVPERMDSAYEGEYHHHKVEATDTVPGLLLKYNIKVCLCVV